MNIVFDVGNVLLRWEPEAAFREVFDSDEETRRFFDAADFFAWNFEQDKGRTLEEAIAAAAPAHRAALTAYGQNFGLTIRDKITESWALMERLRAGGHRIFAITNFSAELWPVALRLHPQLGEVFEDVIVSGEHRMWKPQRAIFDLLCARNGLKAQECVFIDDSLPNAEGAEAAGWMSHHFTTPEMFRQRLLEWKLI